MVVTCVTTLSVAETGAGGSVALSGVVVVGTGQSVLDLVADGCAVVGGGAGKSRVVVVTSETRVVVASESRVVVTGETGMVVTSKTRVVTGQTRVVVAGKTRVFVASQTRMVVTGQTSTSTSQSSSGTVVGTSRSGRPKTGRVSARVRVVNTWNGSGNSVTGGRGVAVSVVVVVASQAGTMSTGSGAVGVASQGGATVGTGRVNTWDGSGELVLGGDVVVVVTRRVAGETARVGTGRVGARSETSAVGVVRVVTGKPSAVGAVRSSHT